MKDLDKKKTNIIALFGEKDCGKDAILKWMVSNIKNSKRIVRCTTQEKGVHEEDGDNYFFLTYKEFTEEILNGSIIEAIEKNDIFYGTRNDELDIEKINIGIFDISSIECLIQDTNLNVIPLYIYLPPHKRLIRQLQRPKEVDCHKICLNFLEEEKEFNDIDFDYDRICGDNIFDLKDIAKKYNDNDINFI